MNMKKFKLLIAFILMITMVTGVERVNAADIIVVSEGISESEVCTNRQ